MDDQNLEVIREVLVNKMMKSNPSASTVKKQMDMTFAPQRKEVVQDKPPIVQILHQWPALFSDSQVCYEFSRVVGKNLRENFLEALLHISPSMIGLFKWKTGAIGQRLNELLQQTKTTEPTDIRCLILRGMAVVLGDDPAAFFKTCSDATDQEVFSQMSVGILCIHSEHPQMNPSRVGIILEGSVVMDKLGILPQAFRLLFGLIYALHLDYPRYIKNTFSFLQQVLLNTGRDKLPAKIQSLKNQFAM